MQRLILSGIITAINCYSIYYNLELIEFLNPLTRSKTQRDKIDILLFSQLMEEFKRAHQKMFNSAQQKAQSSEQAPKEVQEKVRENKSF